MTADRERARAAALGQADWGWHGSAQAHHRYVEALPKRYTRRGCGCGCGGRQTHVGKANGVALTSGCEMSMRRWAK